MRTFKWRDIIREVPREVLEGAARKAGIMAAGLELNTLRKARRLTPEELSLRLRKIREANVAEPSAKMNMRIGALRDIVEAMGGKLRITAHFPDSDYRIEPFDPKQHRKHNGPPKPRIGRGGR